MLLPLTGVGRLCHLPQCRKASDTIRLPSSRYRMQKENEARSICLLDILSSPLQEWPISLHHYTSYTFLWSETLPAVCSTALPARCSVCLLCVGLKHEPESYCQLNIHLFLLPALFGDIGCILESSLSSFMQGNSDLWLLLCLWGHAVTHSTQPINPSLENCDLFLPLSQRSKVKALNTSSQRLVRRVSQQDRT